MLSLMMMLAGPMLDGVYLFGPSVYDYFYPQEAQTLPSAYFINDDIQYFPQGPEFMLEAGTANAETIDESVKR